MFCSWAMCSRLQARAKVRPHQGASEPLPHHHREGPLRRKVGRGRGPPPGDPYCPRCCVVAFGAETPKAREGPPIPPDSLPPPRGHMELWGPAAGLPQAGRQGVAKWLWGHVLRESFSRGQFLEHRWQGTWLVEAGPLGGVEALQARPTQQGLPWPIVTLLQAPPLPRLSRELRTGWPASRLHAGAPGQGGLGLWKVLDVLPFTVGGRRSHRNQTGAKPPLSCPSSLPESSGGSSSNVPQSPACRHLPEGSLDTLVPSAGRKVRPAGVRPSDFWEALRLGTWGLGGGLALTGQGPAGSPVPSRAVREDPCGLGWGSRPQPPVVEAASVP